MRIITDVQDIIKAVQLASKILPSRPSNTAEETVMIRACGDVAEIQATAQGRTGCYRVPVSFADGEESVRVNGRMLADIIAKLRPGEVTLETEDGFLRIINGKSKSRLMLVPNLPDINPLEGSKEIAKMKAGALLAALKKTIYAVASEGGARVILTGVCIKRVEGGAELCALDGFRMSIVSVSDEIDTDGIVIPADGVKIMIDMLSCLNADDSVTLSMHGGTLITGTSDMEVGTLLLSGQYVDYGRIINNQLKTHQTNVQFNRSVMRDALSRASVATGKSNLIQMHFSPDTIKITARDSNGVVEIDEEVDCDCDAESEDVAFNAKYMMDALANADLDTLDMVLAGPTGLVQIHDGNDLIGILPVRMIQ